MIKAVLFDIDNTLFDSTTLAEMARRNSVKAMIDSGLPIKDEALVYKKLQEVIKKFGSNYPKHYDELLNTLSIPWSAKIVAAGVVAYEHTKFGYLKPYPGVIPALMRLKKKDYLLGVVSNGIAVKQWEKLIGLGVHHFFDAVVTSEEAGVEKPEEEIFLLATQKLGVKPEECVMVGDRVKIDIYGAKRVGMKTIWLKKGKYSKEKPENSMEEPDITIDSFFSLVECVELLNKNAAITENGY